MSGGVKGGIHSPGAEHEQMLQEALLSDLALATLEDHLIQRAGVLYRMGFTPGRISQSQMSAIEERIRTALSLEDAKSNAESFLKHQLNKLMAQACSFLIA